MWPSASSSCSSSLSSILLLLSLSLAPTHAQTISASLITTTVTTTSTSSIFLIPPIPAPSLSVSTHPGEAPQIEEPTQPPLSPPRPSTPPPPPASLTIPIASVPSSTGTPSPDPSVSESPTQIISLPTNVQQTTSVTIITTSTPSPNPAPSEDVGGSAPISLIFPISPVPGPAETNNLIAGPALSPQPPINPINPGNNGGDLDANSPANGDNAPNVIIPNPNFPDYPRVPTQSSPSQASGSQTLTFSLLIGGLASGALVLTVAYKKRHAINISIPTPLGFKKQPSKNIPSILRDGGYPPLAFISLHKSVKPPPEDVEETFLEVHDVVMDMSGSEHLGVDRRDSIGSDMTTLTMNDAMSSRASSRLSTFSTASTSSASTASSLASFTSLTVPTLSHVHDSQTGSLSQQRSTPDFASTGPGSMGTRRSSFPFVERQRTSSQTLRTTLNRQGRHSRTMSVLSVSSGGSEESLSRYL
ncbi:hypothetical protein BC832DRAFT_588934 [Gaertneriomyces semiglobifer]|nr:hypothetical protein BC832DRAFT_588934 [Gaertneriomyces semiglobifer]